MHANPHHHPRPPVQSGFRPPGSDHRALGGYFITVSSAHRMPMFGVPRGGRILLTRAGALVSQCWMALPEQFSHLELDAFVVMPDHVRGILLLRRRSITPIGLVVRCFKFAAKKRINLLRGTPGEAVWQSRYHEQAIRDAKAMETMRRYVTTIPWEGKMGRHKP